MTDKILTGILILAVLAVLLLGFSFYKNFESYAEAAEGL